MNGTPMNHNPPLLSVFTFHCQCCRQVCCVPTDAHDMKRHFTFVQNTVCYNYIAGLFDLPMNCIASLHVTNDNRGAAVERLMLVPLIASHLARH
jgi:hypothetical protein